MLGSPWREVRRAGPAMQGGGFLRVALNPMVLSSQVIKDSDPMVLVPRLGGTHHGYFLPHESPNDLALALFSFPLLAAYEEYRLRMASATLRIADYRGSRLAEREEAGPRRRLRTGRRAFWESCAAAAIGRRRSSPEWRDTLGGILHLREHIRPQSVTSSRKNDRANTNQCGCRVGGTLEIRPHADVEPCEEHRRSCFPKRPGFPAATLRGALRFGNLVTCVPARQSDAGWHL